jgi:DNA-binding IclR family transcriptional regulator
MPAANDSMIDRVARILEAFSAGERALSPTELGRRAGLPTPTAHRIVGDLVRSGLLERDTTGKIRVGIRLWELVARSAGTYSLREIALPFMDDLQGVVRQHTQLSVLDKSDVLYLEVLSSSHSSAPNVTKPGTRLPVLACASGIVLAAFSPPEIQEELFQAKVTAFTPHTITDRSLLRKEIAKAHVAGYALASGWIHAYSSGLAVPILLEDGTAVGALSVTTPRGEAEKLTLLSGLRTTARVISRSLRVGNRMADPGLNLLRQQIRRATEVG